MMNSTHIQHATGYRQKSGACLRELAVAFQLVLGIMMHHYSWAQESQAYSDDDGQNKQTTMEDQYPVRLNDVTLRNQIVWAAQAYVAPERLEEVVPLFVYKYDEVVEQLSALYDESSYTELYLGLAIQESCEDENNQDVWRVKPLHSFSDSLLNNNDKNSCLYIASSKPFEEVSAVENLWTAERNWHQ